MKNRSISLLSRSAIVVGITLFISQVVIISLIIVFLVLPVIQNSAVTMAAIMKTSTQQWLELSADQHEQFTQNLDKNYNFKLQAYQYEKIDTTARPHEPYIFYLEDALSNELGQYVRFFEDKKHTERYWINFKYQDHHFEIAIPLHQLGGQPHIIIIAIILSGLFLTFVSSWFLAYHLNKPIRRMVTAVKQVSNGISPKPIPEQGCKELVVLAESVNIMAKKVKELLENRTIMLAGISHDLRTPLTRMALSVEMLPEADDSILMQHIHKDIALMNEMIGHYMELACCLTEEKPEEHDIYSLLSAYISEIRRHANVSIDLKTAITSSEMALDTLRIYQVAFKRIISNLLGNAIRYGEGKPIIVSYEKVEKRGEDWIQISIIDQGPGISEKELERVFQPFYKVDKSRNSKLGGSGLGLAIVSHLAQAHGWHIELYSPQSGGLIAQVTLPVN